MRHYHRPRVDTADHPRSPIADNNNGLSLAELAGTCYEAYRMAALGHDCPLCPWQDLGEGSQEGWAHVVQELTPVIAEADNISWLTLARMAYMAYGEGTLFEDEPPVLRLRWEAVARHLANMLDWERDDDQPVEKHQMFWRDWLAGRAAQLGRPEV
jgi:hypothetical protein